MQGSIQCMDVTISIGGGHIQDYRNVYMLTKARPDFSEVGWW